MDPELSCQIILKDLNKSAIISYTPVAIARLQNISLESVFADQQKYNQIVAQPNDLNLDGDTLMKIVSVWRTSLSDSNAPSQQFYFDHFGIHPIKIIATFVPGESYSSYNSAQEALRTLLHSVVPPIKRMVAELNGVLVNHALKDIIDQVCHEVHFHC
ncbi:uncharacterized protein LOC111291850 isoform X2 [Durio zibethinus]|uniref:Uncharacterized protein LOC111291850 isoform X2 n=1 Tax=Durio zibethinus TaxID=66656 RepID=A0A6P5YGW1_DURZI|nr:uncharacterized protein LOC111291850 isoform X2 [Durio zibethinus]